MLPGLLFGFCSITAAALLQNFCLQKITTVIPRERLGKQWITFCVFTLLALLHVLEIVAFAAILALLSHIVWPASFTGSAPLAMSDFLYLAAINFTTLGFSQLEVTGPLRMVTMLQSLGGFMLLTWSAGYLYSACGAYWRA